MKNYRQIIIGLIIGTVIGYSVFEIVHENNMLGLGHLVNRNQEKHEGGGVLTNPLLECLTAEDDGTYPALNISKPTLTSFVNRMLKNNKVNFISVYIRDLNNGPWIGINEKEEFIGSSLLKVPILISYMKLAESDRGLLDSKIKYTTKIIDDDQYYTPEKVLEVGQKYTVKELLDYMIMYSDNNAANILVNGVENSEMDSVFEALGLGKPVFNTPYPVNVRNYAGFFRILFNASYINKEYSEKTLNVLTQTKFDRGITALLPKNLVVAHKFGIRSDGPINQLHDCGIVYYPRHPYLLCVMSRGGNFDDLASSIAQISKFVYEEVDKNHD